MKSTLEFTTELARSTGDILLDHFNPLGIISTLKKDNTVLTQADLDADTHIAEAIGKEFPDDLIVSEEANTQVKGIDQAIWIIDPLDGTTNFSLGLPIWGVSIARIVNGMPTVGVLNFPALGELYSAESGGGAQLNGMPIQARGDDGSSTSAFFTCCTRTHRKYQVEIPLKTRILGAAAYNMVSIAKGSSVIAFESTPKIWDIAASWLIVEEARGLTNVLSGQDPFPLEPGIDYEEQAFPTIMGATKKMMQMARENIQLRK